MAVVLLRPRRRIKKPVFLGCEGQSELGYGRWLNKLAYRFNIPVAIKAEPAKGGDALVIIQRSIEKLVRIERRGAKFAVKAILLDADRLEENPRRDRDALRLARNKNIHLIWQLPCHEAFILHHFDQFQDRRPLNSNEAAKQLRKVWPNYKKGGDANDYNGVLDLENLSHARSVNGLLDEFLTSIGWE